MSFQIGQRWMSQTEPELGLGIVVSLESKKVSISFPLSNETRVYGLQSSPLKRVVFSEGDELRTSCGMDFVVLEVEDIEGIIIYLTEEENIPETRLCGGLSFKRPEERLFSGNLDANSVFDLRKKSYHLNNEILHSPYRGFLGGKMDLLPHQFYVAKEICDRKDPRVLLCDEVGLGKTIEAGLIVHQMLITGKIERALIVTPNSLVYQWFVEFLKKFNLNFSVLNQETYLEKGTNPFRDNQLVITGIGFLKGSEVARDFLEESEFDLLVVDEAHQLKWSEEKVGVGYQLIESLCQRISKVLLLTATPEQLGVEGHFGRLKLLDPDKFYDLKNYLKEQSQFKETAELGKSLYEGRKLTSKEQKKLEDLGLSEVNSDKALEELIDFHGPGRVIFRNSREIVAKSFKKFPERKMVPYFLKSEDMEDQDLKNQWVLNFVQNNREEKILLIGQSKKRILELEQFLKANLGNSYKIALFHSDLNPIARDRNAAYFEDPEGAKILLCTEIGSEGRNFQFCQNLILFDLPDNPDRLEQRIGRLDRIGQEKSIHIHMPVIQHSGEEVLFQLYQELGAFEGPLTSGGTLFESHQEELIAALENPKPFLEGDSLPKLLQSFIKGKKKLDEEIQKGRDILVELNSFNPDKAYPFVEGVKEVDHSSSLRDYLEIAFHHFGVEMEDLEDGVYFVRPSNNMYIPAYPGLPSDGMSVTFSREKALEKPGITFLTYDHPLVTGTLNLILSNEFGNVTLRKRKNSKKDKVYFELYFLLHIVSPKKIGVERFFPPTLLRVLLDHEGKNLSEKWNEDFIEENTLAPQKQDFQMINKIPRAITIKAIKEANQLASTWSQEQILEFKQSATTFYDKEIKRLEFLRSKNPLIREDEVEDLKTEKDIVLSYMESATIGHDSIKVIF